MKENLVRDKSFHFALISISLYKKLLLKNEFVLSRQFFKSATSIGANIEEALAGSSRKDFVAKMSIASREARESMYWLKLIKASEFIDYDYTELFDEAETLVKLLTSIVKTTKSTLEN